jgi:PKD repeat protein
VASFLASPRLIVVGGTINFTAFDSEDEDGTIVTYEWSFGDGTDGTGRSVSHTYTETGTYTVILRVTDDDGLSDTTQQDIYVEAGEPAGPSAEFTSSPNSGTSPLAVYFDAAGTSYTQGPLNFYWDFGDGATGFGETVSHLYVTSAGSTYTVTLTVTAPDGKTGTATGTVTVSAPGTSPSPSGSPSARFSINFDDITQDPATEYENDDVAPVRVWLDPEDSEADTGRTLATYTWSFGDGTAASSISPDIQEHVFITDDTSEIFSITLVVIDDEGATDDITKTVQAKNYLPIAGFEVGNVTQQSDSNTPPGGWWTDEDPDQDNDDERITFRNVPTEYREVWIRSRRIVDADWLGKDNADPVPTTKTGEPDEFDDENGPNMCFDPEGQTWEDNDADPDMDPPAWFPNRAWGIQRLRVNWGDGHLDIIEFDDDADTVASHDYDFTAGGVKSWTITVTAVDFLGGEDSYSRVITFNEG